MHKFLSLIFLATSLLISSAAVADQGQFYLAPGAQWMNFDDETLLDNDTGYFLGFGYSLTDRISAELSTFDLDPEFRDGTEVDIDHYKLDLLYDVGAAIGKFQPFVVGGIGNSKFEGDNDTSFDYGGGFKFELSDNLEWRTAVRVFNHFGRDREDADFGIDTSLVFYFGNRSGRESIFRRAPVASPAPATPREPQPAPAATPAAVPTQAPDTDRDGVVDSLDACPDTPVNYAVDTRGCPIPVEEIARVELMVNFDFDRSEVKSEYFDEIEEVATFMEQNPELVIELEGHTDGRGNEQYNQGLSERRAAAVRQVMIDRFNVQASRISSRGFGESQPVASNATDEGRAQNRRVMTVIIQTLQNYQPR